MGRGEGRRKDGDPGGPGRDKIGVSIGAFLLLAYSLWPAAAECAGGRAPVLTDLWDHPRAIGTIAAGRSTIFFVCEADLEVCREGAVFFDSRAGEIEARGLGAALIFAGPPAGTREFVLRSKITQPVYIDPTGRIFGTLVEQKVLPALVLVDGKGRHLKTLYGGGESLEGNLGILLAQGSAKGRRWWLIVLPVAVAAAVLVPLVLN
jgi:hypothetical protein